MTTGGDVYETAKAWREDNDVTVAATAVTAVNAESNVQSVADQVNQAVNGGSATGTPITDVLANLTNIPQENIAINASAGATAVAFDAAGTGGSNTGSANTLQTTGTHTIGAGANYVMVVISYSTDTQFTNVTPTVTYGAQSMSLLGATYMNSSGRFEAMAIFGLVNPASGTQTITATISSFVSCRFLGMESSSYSGWGATSAMQASRSNGSSLSQTVAASTGTKIVQAFSAYRSAPAANAALSAYNRTQRGNTGNVAFGLKAMALLMGDADGAASVAFSATAASASDWYAGIAVVLSPANPGVVGSSAFIKRTSTGTANFVNGAALLPTSFFDAIDHTSDDITVDLTNGKFTVTYAGSYIVDGRIKFSTTVSTGAVHLLLYRTPAGGSVAIHKYGPQATTSNANSMYGVWKIYLSAGDSVQLGGTQGSGITLNTLTGEATGVETYFSMSLANRSFY